MLAPLSTDRRAAETPVPLAPGLALTPFEEYMLLDDTDEYPMSFHNWCRLVGPVDRETLDAALVDAQLRHPGQLRPHGG